MPCEYKIKIGHNSVFFISSNIQTEIKENIRESYFSFGWPIYEQGNFSGWIKGAEKISEKYLFFANAMILDEKKLFSKNSSHYCPPTYLLDYSR